MITRSIRLAVPPDQTPAEEAELVARVADSISQSTGAEQIDFELHKPEETSYQALSGRTGVSDRWNR